MRIIIRYKIRAACHLSVVFNWTSLAWVATVRRCAAQDGTRQHDAALKIRNAVLHSWGEALYLENMYSN